MTTLLAEQDLNLQKDVRLAMLSLRVNPWTAPWLVSGATIPYVWVSKHRNGVVRAALRTPYENESKLIIEAVVEMGERAEWGNVHPLTQDGIQAAVTYLTHFDFHPGELELLAHPDTAKGLDFLKKKPTETDWMPPKHVVVVPKERAYLGAMGRTEFGKVSVLVHNAARGMAVARAT